MTRRRAFQAVACAAAAMTVYTCGACSATSTTLTPSPSSSSSPAPSGYHRPPTAGWAEHWNPSPALDLMSPDGTFIRAFRESGSLTILTDDPATHAYPGFLNADHTNTYSFGGIRTWHYVGFSSQTVIRFDRPTPDTAIATICTTDLVTGSTVHVSPSDIARHIRYPYIDIITYHRVGKPPPANQHGTRNAPIGNVFGDWYATNHDFDDVNIEPCRHLPVNQNTTTSTPGWPESGA